MKNIKKYVLTIILAICCLLAFNDSTLAAGVAASNSLNNQGEYTLTNDDGLKSGKYAVATFGGIKAYCIDPGKNPVANGKICTPQSLGDDDFAKAAKYIFSSNKSESQKGTAIRIVAIATGKGSFGYKGTSKNQVNAKCSYIAAAYKAANKAGYTIKNTSLADAKSYAGSNCATSFQVKGSVIDFAADALKASKTAASTGESAPTATVTSSNGVAYLTIDNTGRNDVVEVMITCTNASGACGSKQVEKNEKQTFIIKSDVNNSTQCGTFTATMTYEGSGNDGACSEVTKYECGSLQDYVGCTAMNTTNVNGGKVTETITDPVNGGSVIKIKCDDEPVEKKKDCTLTEDPAVTADDGVGNDAICKADGSTVVFIGDNSLYTKDDTTIENCLLNDERGHLVYQSTNKICKTYCAEDYSFKSSGLALTDKDYVDGKFVITAGSYFNFKDGKAYEKAHVTCVTEIDMKSFGDKVRTAADTYIKNFDSETRTCSEYTKDDGTKVYIGTTVKKEHSATYDYNNHKVEFHENVITDTKEYASLSECPTSSTSAPNEAAIKQTYQNQVNSYVSELNECASKPKQSNYIDDECDSKVTFDYGYNVDPYDLTDYKEVTSSESTIKVLYNCKGEYSESSCSVSTGDVNPTAQLDLGVSGVSKVTISTTEYINKVDGREITYSLEGIGICNNYNDGTSKYPVAKSECSEDGTTWVQGWPISYDTPQGQYTYEVNVEGYGHIKYYGSDECYGLDKYLNRKVSYGCKYGVNGCVDCPFECDPDADCDPSDCDKECLYECLGVGCIYDPGNGLAMNYQPISMINVTESFGYLSDRYSGVDAVASRRESAPRATRTASTSPVNSVNWGSEKGQATLKKIEDQGEEIYAGEPEYSVILTPATIKQIKRTNNEDGNTYLNKSLKCTTNGNKEYDGIKYVTCTSEFLDGLANEHILTRNASAQFKSIDDINNDSSLSEFNIVAERKSGTGPAWK